MARKKKTEDKEIPEQPDAFGEEFKKSDAHRPIEDLSDEELDEADKKAGAGNYIEEAS